jgi:hypothetical protein
MAHQNIYHRLADPLNPAPDGEVAPKYSRLHNLYPGRPMESTSDYNKYNIPAEDPEAARKSFEDRRRDTHEYATRLQEIAINAGGGDKNKVTVHSAIDPDQMIEDPELKFISMVSPATDNDSNSFIENKEEAKEGTKREEYDGDNLVLTSSGQEKFLADKRKETFSDQMVWVILALILATVIILVILAARGGDFKSKLFN